MKIDSGDYTEQEIVDMLNGMSTHKCPVDSRLIDHHNNTILREHFKMAIEKKQLEAKRPIGNWNWAITGASVTLIVIAIIHLVN